MNGTEVIQRFGHHITACDVLGFAKLKQPLQLPRAGVLRPVLDLQRNDLVTHFGQQVDIQVPLAARQYENRTLCV
jgi:hypothetical protein